MDNNLVKHDTNFGKEPLKDFVIIDVDKDGDGSLKPKVITKGEYLKNKGSYENQGSGNPVSFDSQKEAEDFIEGNL
jgi:hypothetical protein